MEASLVSGKRGGQQVREGSRGEQECVGCGGGKKRHGENGGAAALQPWELVVVCLVRSASCRGAFPQECRGQMWSRHLVAFIRPAGSAR